MDGVGVGLVYDPCEVMFSVVTWVDVVRWLYEHNSHVSVVYLFEERELNNYSRGDPIPHTAMVVAASKGFLEVLRFRQAVEACREYAKSRKCYRDQDVYFQSTLMISTTAMDAAGTWRL